MTGLTGEPRPLKVITVAYGTPELLERALAPMAGRLPVVVVDNSSQPAVREVAERHAARYLDPGRNLGFGRAVNEALRDVLGGEPADVLLLNPDATLEVAGARALQAYLHRSDHGDVAAVSARLVGVDGAPQRELWPFPSPGRAWLEAIGLSRLNRAGDFAVAAVIMLRWEALQEVGGFDERFFLYAEETDWQRRAAELGWRSDVCREVVAIHVGAATSTRSDRREALFHSGTEIYVRKWFGSAGWSLYRAAAVAGAAGRGIVLTGARGAAARRRALLYVRGPRRVAGAQP